MVNDDDLAGQLKPPAVVKDVYKRFQRMKNKEFDGQPDVINLDTSSVSNQRPVKQISFSDLPEELQVISNDFLLSKLRQSGDRSMTDHVQQAAELTSIPGKPCHSFGSRISSEQGRSVHLPFFALI